VKGEKWGNWQRSGYFLEGVGNALRLYHSGK